MPIPQSQVILKSYFETADVPTQAQFAELIDTMFYLVNDAKATANAAAAVVAGVVIPKALLRVGSITGVAIPPSGGGTILSQLNVASFTYLSGGLSGVAIYRITWTAALPDANYRLLLTGNGTAVILAITTTYCDVALTNSTTLALLAL